MKQLLIIILLLFPAVSFAFTLDAEIDRLADKYHAKLDSCDSDSGSGCNHYRVDLFLLIKDKLKDNKDAEAILATIECESQFDPNAIGDSGASRGLVQINRPSWPTISRAQAFDPAYSMDFIIEQFRLGHARYWTCFRLYARKSALILALR